MEAYRSILESGHPVIYRLMVFLALVLGGRLIARDARSWPIKRYQTILILSVAYLGSLLGSALPALFARKEIGLLAWQMVYSSSGLWHGIAFEFAFGPKTVVGGLLTSFFAVAGFKTVMGIKYDTSDSFALGACLMMAIGRLGCIAQHCCFGIVVPGFLGVDYGDGLTRFPVQVLEAAFLFCTFAYLNSIQRRDLWRGRRLFIFFVIYGLGRFFLEFLREQIAEPVMGLGFYQWIALALALTGYIQILKRSPSRNGLSVKDQISVIL